VSIQQKQPATQDVIESEIYHSYSARKTGTDSPESTSENDGIWLSTQDATSHYL
jgi:hypothetical protein